MRNIVPPKFFGVKSHVSGPVIPMRSGVRPELVVKQRAHTLARVGEEHLFSEVVVVIMRVGRLPLPFVHHCPDYGRRILPNTLHRAVPVRPQS